MKLFNNKPVLTATIFQISSSSSPWISIWVYNTYYNGVLDLGALIKEHEIASFRDGLIRQGYEVNQVQTNKATVNFFDRCKNLS